MTDPSKTSPSELTAEDTCFVAADGAKYEWGGLTVEVGNCDEGTIRFTDGSFIRLSDRFARIARPGGSVKVTLHTIEYSYGCTTHDFVVDDGAHI